MAVPGPGLRLIFGAMAREVLLASARVRPERLAHAGFRFRHPELPAALGAALGFVQDGDASGKGA
jgi:NAD dependent epimerase/dehydratase family enzyme